MNELNVMSSNETIAINISDNFMKCVLLMLSLSITGNVFTIGVFAKLKQNPVCTRCLFINHAVSDGLTEILVTAIIVLLITRNIAIVIAKVHVLKVVYALHGVSVHTLCGIALNLYLSICHSRKYRQLVSWKPFAVFLLSCWVFNFGVILPMLYTQEMYSGTIYPNYAQNTFGIWVVIMSCDLLVPFPLIIFCVVRIVRMSTRIEPIRCLGSQLQHKMKLSKVITVTTMYYMASTCAIHITRIFQYRLPQYSKSLQVVIKVLGVIMFGYHVFKFPFYMAVYKPIRQEVFHMFRRNRVIPLARPTRRTQAVNTITV